VLLPNRRAHDHIGQFKAAGMREREISKIIASMEALVKKGVSLRDLELVAKNLIKDRKFKEAFLNDAFDAVGRIGINPVPSP